MDDDWIEIDRIDVSGLIGGKLGQPDHQVGERFRVRRRQAAKRSENLRAFEAVEQRACGNDIEGYRGQRDIAQRFDQNAAEADHQQQSPGRVAVDAENDFASRRRHRLHQDAVDLRRRRIPIGGGEHILVGHAHPISSGEIQSNGAGLGFVRDIG